MLSFSDAERRARRAAQQGWWSFPTANTVDRATSLFPRLLYERLDELGLDFAVLYPTGALGIAFNPDLETRRATCRAFNTYFADEFGPLRRPDDAGGGDSDGHARGGNRGAGIRGRATGAQGRGDGQPDAASDSGGRAQKCPEAARCASWLRPDRTRQRLHDYDPVWAKCQELGVAPTFHSGSRGVRAADLADQFRLQPYWPFRRRRRGGVQGPVHGRSDAALPDLKFAFLEGGVGWACNLYADLIGHWKKRNLERWPTVNPANLTASYFRAGRALWRKGWANTCARTAAKSRSRR